MIEADDRHKFAPGDDRAFGAVYGPPEALLVPVQRTVRQFSPVIPGSDALEVLEPGTLDDMAMYAAPGTLERRYAIAAMLQALRPGGAFAVMAPNAKGGTRLADELAAFGCSIRPSAKRHHRIVEGERPATLAGVAEAVALGGPRYVPSLGLWSQPGVFSWQAIDPGTALLAATVPALAGRGADLGCGIGPLAHAVLASGKVDSLHLTDIDRRAVELARRNVDDGRATFAWADLRRSDPGSSLDFVVTNPPFHEGGREERDLGRLFAERAAGALRSGGSCWLVANRHLPFEATMKPLFRSVEIAALEGGFKVLHARK